MIAADRYGFLDERIIDKARLEISQAFEMCIRWKLWMMALGGTDSSARYRIRIGLLPVAAIVNECQIATRSSTLDLYRDVDFS
jgi:hypothetical protein